MRHSETGVCEICECTSATWVCGNMSKVVYENKGIFEVFERVYVFIQLEAVRGGVVIVCTEDHDPYPLTFLARIMKSYVVPIAKDERAVPCSQRRRA